MFWVPFVQVVLRFSCVYKITLPSVGSTKIVYSGRALDDYALAEIENGPRLGWFRSKSGAAGLLCRT